MGGNEKARGRQPPLLQKRLATFGADEDRGNACGSDQQRRDREAHVSRIVLERQQCSRDAAKDVSKAKEGKLIHEVPDFALFRERGRSLRLNDEAERRLSAVAEQALKDIIVVMRDTGMRNARELYCMRVENVDFDAGTVFTPDSKTESGRRFIPMSSRVKQILEARCAGRSEGWVWMSRYKGKHIGEWSTSTRRGKSFATR